MSNRIALVGLGQMGLPIAARLATTFDVLAFDILAERRELAAANERVATTDDLEQLTAADVVVLSLPNPAISKDVLTTLSGRLAPGTTVIETSTVLPADVRDCQRLVESAQVRIVDAAVLSGVAQMEQGNATLLVGGEDVDLDAVSSVLEVMGGGGVQRFGGLGAGMAAKVVNNGVAHAVMVVLVEAFAMAEAEGVSLEAIAGMLDREDGGLQRPLNHRIMQRMADGDFAGGMPLEAARKDSTLALAMAQSSGTPLFATQAAQTVYDVASRQGMGRMDYSSIAQLWEGWTGRSLDYGGAP